jgi:hypothetical protein
MPAYKISDLVKCDTKAEFRNDVQLSAYDDKDRNLSLVNSYLFTSDAPEGTKSSTQILLSTIQTLLNERQDNRSVVVATFGHGKSHLALTIANYFGRPANSEPYKAVLQKIINAFSGSSNFKTFQQFKESRGEFVVVRLRGDVPGNLREQFLTNLENELGNHEISKNHRLPGWYEKAEKYLIALEGKELKKANAFLEKFEIDVPMLVQNVKRKQDSAYDKFIDLYAHLDEHGFKPNMEGELSLAVAVKWAVENFCGDGKLGGVVVLFDEFSLYVQNYAKRTAAGELQDLLNGIDECRGKAVFIAFAQQDPITAAQNALVGAAPDQKESLLKELTRIPQKFVLHSLMESVIDSYLDQPNDKWQRFLQEPNVSILVAQATNVALDQFKDRYTKLGWTSVQKFEETVTKGCFPLHPITTAMLCNTQFQSSVSASGTPRNILGFILEQLDNLQDKQAIVGRQINWVLPIYLVDYFGERLPAERYRAYQQAIERIVDDEKAAFSANDQKDILKALLLQEVSALKARDEDQIDLIASMVGVPPSDTKKCLRFLSDSKVIAWNQDGRKSYSLWASSFNPFKLDQILDRKVKGVEVAQRDLLNLSENYLGATQVSIPWGHPQDWQAREYLLTVEHFNAKTLQDLAGYYRYDDKNGLQEGIRSCLIWLVAQNQDDMAFYKQSAQKILDEAFSETEPLPIVLLLPAHENPLLITSIRNKKTLASFTQTEKDECGPDVFRAREAQEETNIQQSILDLRGGDNYSDIPRFHTQFVVPKPYKARIQQMGNTSLQRMLEAIYAIAYRFAPPEFFQQYQLSARNFRNTVKTVSIDILHSDASSLGGTIRSNSSANDLVKLLIQKWTIIASDNRVKSPVQDHVFSAWEKLDNSFPSGESENLVKDVVLSLLNPPFGYDYNTLVLIFCAWFGLNSHNLQVIADGAPINIKQVDAWLQVGPREFVNSLLTHKVALARRDLAKATKEIKALLAKVKKGGLSQKEAKESLAKFEDFINTEEINPDLASEASNEIKNIQSSLEVVYRYEKQAKDTLGAIGRERSIQKIVDLLDTLDIELDGTLVSVDAPLPAEIRSKVQKWLEEIVETQCKDYEEIEDIADLNLHRRDLETLRQDLTRLKLPTLAERVKKSIATLADNAESLRVRQEEASIQNELRMLQISAPLKSLYDFCEKWKKQTGLSKETQKLRDAQIRAAEQEIDRVESDVDDLEKDIERIDSKHALDILNKSLLLLAHRVDGTALSKKLVKPMDTIESLGQFFEELWKVDNTVIATEEIAQALRARLNDVSRRYSKLLSDKQKQAIENSGQSIEKRIREYEQQASLLVDEYEKTYAKGVKIVELRAQMERPISFLTEKERKRLNTLIVQVDKKLDEDVILQIEHNFRKIKDNKIRQKCIKRLIEIEKE